MRTCGGAAAWEAPAVVTVARYSTSEEYVLNGPETRHSETNHNGHFADWVVDLRRNVRV